LRKIQNIIIHCSDSGWGCAREIRKWHTTPPRNWRDIGYHFVIQNGHPLSGFYLPALDGQIECGRYLDENSFLEDLEKGAHTLGYNGNSIGICLVGKHQFTIEQNHTLRNLLNNLVEIYDIKPENVLGHNETSSGKEQGKTCPNFDVAEWRAWLIDGNDAPRLPR
jgi:N-acetylmuramoyl-L-alanine amidase